MEEIINVQSAIEEPGIHGMRYTWHEVYMACKLLVVRVAVIGHDCRAGDKGRR